MGKVIDYDDFCKEVDKGDLLVGNNAEWAKEIAWRTPEAKSVVPFPSDEENEDRIFTIKLTEEEMSVLYCALGVQILEFETEQHELSDRIVRKIQNEPTDIEEFERNEERLKFLRDVEKKLKRKSYPNINTKERMES